MDSILNIFFFLFKPDLNENKKWNQWKIISSKRQEENKGKIIREQFWIFRYMDTVLN